MPSDDIIEEGELEIEPTDLPTVTEIEFLTAGKLIYDAEKSVVEIDGEKRYLPEDLANKLL